MKFIADKGCAEYSTIGTVLVPQSWIRLAQIVIDLSRCECDVAVGSKVFGKGHRIRHVVELTRARGAASAYQPELKGFEPCGRGVSELVSWDCTRASEGVFRLSDPAGPEYLLRLSGLDVSWRHRVTFDNSGDSCVLDGLTVTGTDAAVRLETTLTSGLLSCEACS